jgi:GNAT superfamily N-acetyltransferase
MPDRVQYEALIAPSQAIVGLPDSRIITRPGWWQIITPSLKNGGLNSVRVEWVDGENSDRIIDDTVAQYAGVSYRWELLPWTTPADLGSKLEARGLKAHDSRVMFRTIDAFAKRPVSVSEVADDLDAFTHVMARGWGSDPKVLDRLHQALLSHPARRHRLFLARDNGVPAGAAASVRLDESVYLMGAVVLPEFRGRGHYAALVNARLNDAVTQGLKLATSIASAKTSAPLLARLGFSESCAVTFYTP